MTYYNKQTSTHYRGGALHTDKGTIFNPSEATLKANGYAPYIAPVVEPTEPTNEEISQIRQSAYEAECDPYLVAYQGYLVEGDEAKAESARRAYLRAKAEVRKRLPYNDNEEEAVIIPLSRDDDLL